MIDIINDSKGKRLEVLENFRTDYELKKHKKPTSYRNDDGDVTESFGVGVKLSSPVQFWDNRTNTITLDTSVRRKALSVFRSLFKRLKAKKSVDLPQISAVEFFSNLKLVLKSNANQYVDRLSLFELKMKKCKSLGQTALYERMKEAHSLIGFESALFCAGLNKYISESELIECSEKCEKGLSLDWIANFCCEIPDEVIEKKKFADDLLVFDNYVVLHYDPKGKAVALTEAEIQAKRDPILFGVIRGSRKLYYIADWISEEANLTLEALEKILGREVNFFDDDPTLDNATEQNG